ncbi:hypothetical protein QJS10_CPA06g00600 [Acorus calamus]|uniref:Uncharacterized protein n=1 Tax=Acorus calamus TaxID=4465 RepID=A0AAV9EJT8_ACOCL|nr:hypothetical protein QJS10_CPA06g00600 [Acorus calamus]
MNESVTHLRVKHHDVVCTTDGVGEEEGPCVPDIQLAMWVRFRVVRLKEVHGAQACEVQIVEGIANLIPTGCMKPGLAISTRPNESTDMLFNEVHKLSWEMESRGPVITKDKEIVTYHFILVVCDGSCQDKEGTLYERVCHQKVEAQVLDRKKNEEEYQEKFGSEPPAHYRTIDSKRD